MILPDLTQYPNILARMKQLQGAGPDAQPSASIAQQPQSPTPSPQPQSPRLSVPGISPPVADYMQQRLYDPEFAQAQQQAANRRNLAMLDQGGNTIAQALTTRGGTLRPIDANSLAPQMQEANRPVHDLMANRQAATQNFQTQRQMALLDPRSPESEMKRAQLRSMLPKIASSIPNLDVMSANQIDGLMANGFKASQEQRESAKDEQMQRHQTKQEELEQKRLEQMGRETQARLEEAKGQHAVANQMAQDRLEQTKNVESDKLWKEYADAITKTHGRSRLTVDNQKRIQAIERLRDYALDDNGNPRPLTPQQVESAMTDFGSVMAGGGVPTEYAIKSQMPHTWKGSLANTMQYFSNHPQDAGAQEFIRLLANQTKDIGARLNEQVLSGQTSELPRFVKALRDQDPETFDNMLRSNGVPLDRIDLKSGRLKTLPKPPPGGHVTVKQNGYTYTWNPETGQYE